MKKKTLEDELRFSEKTFFARLRKSVLRYMKIASFILPLSLGIACGPDYESGSNINPLPYCPSGFFYQDNDNDSYGALETTTCENLPGSVQNAGDCDDTDAGVNPEVVDICEDNKDNDCDGIINNGCPKPQCFYKCGTPVLNTDFDDQKIYSGHCINKLNGECDYYDSAAIFLGNGELVKFDIDVSPNLSFYKLVLDGSLHNMDFDNMDTPRVFLDGIENVSYRLKEDDYCKPLVFMMRYFMDYVVNENVLADGNMSMILKFGLLTDDIHSCSSCTDEYYPNQNEKDKDSCNYGLTDIKVIPCSYCDPVKDSSCYQCNPSDPICECK